MGLDFPSGASDGDGFKGYIFRSSRNAWTRGGASRTALRKNYLVNPAFQHSQELALGTYIPGGITGAGYVADQWYCSWNGQAGSAQNRAGVVALTTINGSANVLEATVTATGTLGADNYLHILHPLESRRVADLQWGSGGFPAVARVWTYSPNVSGTASVFVRNAAANYSYPAPLTVTAGAWVRNDVAIPPPPGGTWPGLTSALGFHFGLSTYCGATYSGPANTWSASNIIAVNGNTFWGAAGGTIYFADMGLYADPFKTGVAPPWEPPDYIAELRRCQRYWWKMTRATGFVYAATPTTINFLGMQCPVPMRIAPTMAIVGTPKMWDNSGTPTITAISSSSSTTTYYVDLTATVASALVANASAVMYYQDENQYISVSARM